ncbi:MAG TPA: GNAT family N-acetyltransferase [Bacteroidia bacterium]|nr:GNAT family N-acetyltransferase [Bacteroidia bacterium]
MIRLAEDTFAVRNDPSQLDVDQDVIERLQKMHSSTLSEHKDENGPVVWILLIPTTNDLMNEFLQNKITEKELFDKTPIGIPYEALYLCSAMVLPEYRRKGIAKRLTVEAIKNIGKKHRLQNLFVWPFSKEGEILAEEIARLVSIKIFKRKN